MTDIKVLLNVMATLRDPQKGCPWDREQTYDTILPYTLEEAYEVADAIQRKDWQELKSELGDLLFQVVFYAQIAKEEGRFDFNGIVAAITEKMIRRHPHVFADAQVSSAEEQTARWEQFKNQERGGNAGESLLDHIAMALPALTRARKMQARMARVGFEWEHIDQVFAKFEEELNELRQGIRNRDSTNIQEEIGDLLFMCVNLSRHLKVDPEAALHQGNNKFERRIRHMEQAACAQGVELKDLTLEQMEALWQAAKPFC